MKTKLSELKGDKVLQITFKDGEIYSFEYVYFLISGGITDDVLCYSTIHETLPLGKSSTINLADASKHYYFDKDLNTFYTLKPNDWENDFRTEKYNR